MYKKVVYMFKNIAILVQKYVASERVRIKHHPNPGRPSVSCAPDPLPLDYSKMRMTRLDFSKKRTTRLALAPELVRRNHNSNVSVTLCIFSCLRCRLVPLLLLLLLLFGVVCLRCWCCCLDGCCVDVLGVLMLLEFVVPLVGFVGVVSFSLEGG
jgi:hypothetical protein